MSQGQWMINGVECYFWEDTARFNTKEEAQQHIENNRHHYNSTVHTYAMTAWRSRVVEKLWDILRTADFNSLKEENNEI
ncbi:hypothetical protein NUI08_001986 [Listeria monocytogenes]|nr:hypothetical protein [Listeria monocytogenes]